MSVRQNRTRNTDLKADLLQVKNYVNQGKFREAKDLLSALDLPIEKRRQWEDAIAIKESDYEQVSNFGARTNNRKTPVIVLKKKNRSLLLFLVVLAIVFVILFKLFFVPKTSVNSTIQSFEQEQNIYNQAVIDCRELYVIPADKRNCVLTRLTDNHVSNPDGFMQIYDEFDR